MEKRLSTRPDLIGKALLKKTPDKIKDNLFLGNKGHAEDLEHLCELGVNVVVQISDAPRQPPFPEYFVYLPLVFADDDEQEVMRYCEVGAALIASNIKTRCIFVHCNGGISRSATIVIAYLMLFEDLSFDDALDFVQSKRACVSPNDGFVM